MKFKGTKGNWKISKSGNETFNICITAEDGGSVCFITNWYEAGNNAKLIAAAPELLEACINALKHHQGGHSDIGYELRSAINKALGE
jgi:hypothetical protein